MRGSLRKKACCRGDIKQWDQILEEKEHDVGVIKNEVFSAFWDAFYMALYGGLYLEDIHYRKITDSKTKDWGIIWAVPNLLLIHLEYPKRKKS